MEASYKRPTVEVRMKGCDRPQAGKCPKPPAIDRGDRFDQRKVIGTGDTEKDSVC